MARSNLVPYFFVWEKGKTMDFSETIIVYDLKLVTDDWSDKKFLLTSKLCPLGAVSPQPRGYIQVLNLENNCIKSVFKEISLKPATNGKSNKAFLLTSKFCPLWAVCPCPGTIYMYKIMKKMYKIRLQNDFLKLVANDRSDKMFLLASKFCPLGLSDPDLWLYTFIKSWIYV